jgi:hypothetical protein
MYLNPLWRFTGEERRLCKIKQRFMDRSYKKISFYSIKTAIKIHPNVNFIAAVQDKKALNQGPLD